MRGYTCLLILVYVMNKGIASEHINASSSYSSFITQLIYCFGFNVLLIVPATATLKFDEI